MADIQEYKGKFKIEITKNAGTKNVPASMVAIVENKIFVSEGKFQAKERVLSFNAHGKSFIYDCDNVKKVTDNKGNILWQNEKYFEAGPHEEVEMLDIKDVNERFMVRCNICRTYAHAYEKKQAITDISKSSCSPGCENCKNLRDSGSTSPAVPSNGTCNDRLHVCPFDGNRWWQANDYFHQWQQVTDDQEWKILNKE